jgi:hypothetical protein
LQVLVEVLTGSRPEVPARERLPGPDTPGFPGLDDYTALLVWCWSEAPEDRPSFQEVALQLRDLFDSEVARRRSLPAPAMPGSVSLDPMDPNYWGYGARPHGQAGAGGAGLMPPGGLL